MMKTGRRSSCSVSAEEERLPHRVDRKLIATYRRTRRFTGEDYDRVFGIIEGLHRTPIEALM